MNPEKIARALIRGTGYGTFAIIWRDLPEMVEARGGYSGPYDTAAEAAERAAEIATFYGYPVHVERAEDAS
jgi:hypothetical protein